MHIFVNISHVRIMPIGHACTLVIYVHVLWFAAEVRLNSRRGGPGGKGPWQRRVLWELYAPNGGTEPANGQVTTICGDELAFICFDPHMKGVRVGRAQPIY